MTLSIKTNHLNIHYFHHWITGFIVKWLLIFNKCQLDHPGPKFQKWREDQSWGELHQWFSGLGGIDAPGCQAINYIFGLFQFLSKSCLRSQAITVSCARASQSLTTVEFVQCERDSLHVPDSRTAGDSKLYQHFIHASEAGVSWKLPQYT